MALVLTGLSAADAPRPGIRKPAFDPRVVSSSSRVGFDHKPMVNRRFQRAAYQDCDHEPFIHYLLAATKVLRSVDHLCLSISCVHACCCSHQQIFVFCILPHLLAYALVLTISLMAMWVGCCSSAHAYVGLMLMPATAEALQAWYHMRICFSSAAWPAFSLTSTRLRLAPSSDGAGESTLGLPSSRH